MFFFYSIQMFGNDFVVLNSFESIYEALVTKANDFAGRAPFYRMELLNGFCEDVSFSTYSKKWVFLKKLTMQSLKVTIQSQLLQMKSKVIIFSLYREIIQCILHNTVSIFIL